MIICARNPKNYFFVVSHIYRASLPHVKARALSITQQHMWHDCLQGRLAWHGLLGPFVVPKNYLMKILMKILEFIALTEAFSDILTAKKWHHSCVVNKTVGTVKMDEDPESTTKVNLAIFLLTSYVTQVCFKYMTLQHAFSPQSLVIFGRDVSQIPCFRNSFLYGIGSGIGGGLLTFLFTSRPSVSLHSCMGIYTVVTLAYWTQCRLIAVNFEMISRWILKLLPFSRYNWSKTKFEYSQMKKGMQQHAMYEGTELEKEVIQKSESV